MKLTALVLTTVCTLSLAGGCLGAYGVRLADLGNLPLPPNPIKVWGRVTSESPLTLSDGNDEITVVGLSCGVGQFVILQGNWDGSTFAVTGPALIVAGPVHGEMIWVPGGNFLMGNNGAEPYSYTSELPQHEVSVPGFWMGRYEVTRGEYLKFMNAGGYSNPDYWSTAGWTWRVNKNRVQPDYWAAQQTWGNPPGAFTQTDSHPVCGVSYYEAEAYCNWAGGYLPTEEQWEKAARWTGSYPNVYPWGNVWDIQKCNSWDDTLYPGFQTAPVGSYPLGASPCGLQDMSGNLWEWVQAWYVSYPGCPTPFDHTGSYRVLRGGGWNEHDDRTRCAFRLSSSPILSNYFYGFRLAR